MRKYIFIAAGGMLGAVLRYCIKNIHVWNYHGSIPLNTLFVNITGSFLLALLLTVAFEVWNFDSDIRLGITTGFLGAYTTFSTLCKETVKLITCGQYFSAISYIAVSVMLGLTSAYIGIILARKNISRFIGNKNEEGLANVIEQGEVK